MITHFTEAHAMELSAEILFIGWEDYIVEYMKNLDLFRTRIHPVR
jgi:hypothetical protein